MKLKDLKGLLKNNSVELLDIINVVDDYYVAEFKKPELLQWIPGDHAIFTINNKDIKDKKWRALSIASRPEEGVIRIGTRIGDNPSSFKSVLRDMTPGDKIDIRGPFGWFKLQDEETPIVMIAGGIGITPIYGILKELEAVNNKRKVNIIYSSTSNYLFKNEIDLIAQKDSNITIHYTENKDETQNKIDNCCKTYGKNAWYYISGAPKMIKGITTQLKSFSIKSKQIINDPFVGI